MKILVLDLDGTIANCDHRLHYIKPQEGGKKDWKKFFDRIPRDSCYPEIKKMVKDLQEDNWEIYVVTGRPERTRVDTQAWLDKNSIIVCGLFMRSNKDNRQDYITKPELVKKNVLDSLQKGDLVIAFEDREQVAENYEKLGIRVYMAKNDVLTWGSL